MRNLAFLLLTTGCSENGLTAIGVDSDNRPGPSDDDSWADPVEDPPAEEEVEADLPDDPIDEFVPGEEVCDGIDNDGDGQIDPDCGELLLSDGNGSIYLLNLSGEILEIYESPVTDPRGVSVDRRDRDGFWVVGTGDLQTYYKLGWDGNLVRAQANESWWVVTQQELRGLDYVLGATTEDDILALVHINSQSKYVVTAVYADDGAAYMQSSVNPNFQSGFWGLRITGFVGEYVMGWITWPERAELELREFPDPFQMAMEIPIGDAHGLAMSDFDVFYVVDAKSEEIVALSSTGEKLSSWPTPAQDPQGLSFVRPK